MEEKTSIQINLKRLNEPAKKSVLSNLNNEINRIVQSGTDTDGVLITYHTQGEYYSYCSGSNAELYVLLNKLCCEILDCVSESYAHKLMLGLNSISTILTELTVEGTDTQQNKELITKLKLLIDTGLQELQAKAKGGNL